MATNYEHLMRINALEGDLAATTSLAESRRLQVIGLARYAQHKATCSAALALMTAIEFAEDTDIDPQPCDCGLSEFMPKAVVENVMRWYDAADNRIHTAIGGIPVRDEEEMTDGIHAYPKSLSYIQQEADEDGDDAA